MKRSLLTHNDEGAMLSFWCPGCKGDHAVPVCMGQKQPAAWLFSGTEEAPTLEPSIKRTSGPFPNEPEFGARAGKTLVCHSFVRRGQIQFLTDCTHSLAGHTMDLPEYPRPAEEPSA